MKEKERERKGEWGGGEKRENNEARAREIERESTREREIARRDVKKGRRRRKRGETTAIDIETQRDNKKRNTTCYNIR